MTNEKKTFQNQANRMAARKKFLDALQEDQRDALQKSFDAMQSCVWMLTECNDLYVSDVAKLQSAYHELQNIFFDIDPSDWQLERFAEHDVKWPPTPRGRPAKSD
jgi:hypothetical protein